MTHVTSMALTCDLCGTLFNCRSTKCRHKKKCKLKQHDPSAVTIINTLEREAQQLREMIAGLKAQAPRRDMLHHFRHEDLGYITHKELKEMLQTRRHNETLLKLAHTIHFNPVHPENMNVAVTKLDCVLLYLKQKWCTYSFDDAAWLLVINIGGIMMEHIDDDHYKSEYTDDELDHFQNWYNGLRSYKEPVFQIVEMFTEMLQKVKIATPQLYM